MAQRIKQVERKWIKNFRKSVLVDLERELFLSHIAHQLFYGRNDEAYPENAPENFVDLYNSYRELDRDAAIDRLMEFLRFIGIDIEKEAIEHHLGSFPSDYDKLFKKGYYILKTFAHYADDLRIDNPYHDNNGDLYFLLRIATSESTHGGQMHLFEEINLPELYNKFTELPPDYDKNPEVKDLFNRIENSNESFFITGKAGTGKSTFIHYFAQSTDKKVIKLAFTGIAAINVGGQTIHSFFRFPLKPLMPKDDEIHRFEDYTEKYKMIQRIDTIIIDEVSMLRADILEAIDHSLRINGGDPNKRFGGKQMLFVGDPFQLPPVVDVNDEVERYLFSEVYPNQYFFSSHAFQEVSPHYHEFKVSYRQEDDLPFVNLLDAVRICNVKENEIALLNRRYNPNYYPTNDEFVITLSTTNAIANVENVKRLRELPYSDFKFEAKIMGEFKPDRYPTSKTLTLKKNAQVVFIKNHPERVWVNGTIAKIDFIARDIIEIRLQDGSKHELRPEIWENRIYKYDRNKKKIVSKVIGTFEQYPIKLAWAITIHKSQGLTFDNVIVNLGTGAFVNGQVYTALSRCRTLEGITLKRKFRPEDIITDERIIEFHKRHSPQTILELLWIDREFTRTILSVHYAFSSQELEQYWESLVLGNAHYCVYSKETEIIYMSHPGLCYNKYIEWTEQLRGHWEVGFFNPYTGLIEGVGDHQAKVDERDSLRSILPLDLSTEIEHRNRCIREHWCAVIAPYQNWDQDSNFEGPDEYDADYCTKHFDKLSFKELKNLYNTSKQQILFNPSIWANTLKELFTKEVVDDLMRK